MSFFIVFISAITLLLLEFTYFKIAQHFNIVDKPNERSSHYKNTIRGGGIIFFFAVTLSFLFSNHAYIYFFAGMFLICLISLLDDVFTLNNKIRIVVHLLSVVLLFIQFDILEFEWFYLLVLAVVIIGIINAYNFMDGINGLTGLYSFITILTLYFINEQVRFISPPFLLMTALSLVIFNFFNARKNAVCFAGDVGSVGIAFFVIFCLGKLIIQTSNFNYIQFLLVYGLDSVTTIIYRFYRGENIFKAHRKHFYQLLVNEKKISHLTIAVSYALVQVIINIVVILFIKSSFYLGISLFTSCLLIFVYIRIKFEQQLNLEVSSPK